LVLELISMAWHAEGAAAKISFSSGWFLPALAVVGKPADVVEKSVETLNLYYGTGVCNLKRI
jgi:hypothetical protein